jgi:hypothetical protein
MILSRGNVCGLFWYVQPFLKEYGNECACIVTDAMVSWSLLFVMFAWNVYALTTIILEDMQFVELTMSLCSPVVTA